MFEVQFCERAKDVRGISQAEEQKTVHWRNIAVEEYSCP
ncbi:unnamed protein product, partial [marine sediment metagenome]